MPASQSICRSLGRTLVVVMVGTILASSALGSLSIHLLHVPDPGAPPPPDVAPPEYGGAVAIDPGDPQPVTMQIWASITAPDNGTMLDDGLYKFYSAYRSSDGGLILGDLNATVNFTGDHNYHWFQGESAGLGNQNDLEGTVDMSDPGHPPLGTDSDYWFEFRSGDGDLDIGHTEVGKPAPPWFLVRHRSGMQSTDEEYSPFPGDPGPQGNPTNDFLIATLTFTPLGPGDGGWQGPDYDELGQSGVTEIWADPRQNGAAQWEENGEQRINYQQPNPSQGTMLGGEAVTLYVASAAAAPPGGPVELVAGAGDTVLDGTAATGSVNWWGWDFDGDGDYEIEGIGESMPAVSYELLSGLGIADGSYTARMTVGWSASDPVNTDTATFGLTLVPEPGTVALLAVGLVTLIRRRK